MAAIRSLLFLYKTPDFGIIKVIREDRGIPERVFPLLNFCLDV